MIRTYAVAILFALTLGACAEHAAQDRAVANLPPCCRKAEGLMSQVAPCCRTKLIAGAPTNDSCCKKSVLTGGPNGECCMEADILIAQIPTCCRSSLQSLKENESCCQEWNPK